MKQSTMAELLSQNLRAAKFRYPSLRPRDRKALADLSRTLRLSLSRGDASVNLIWPLLIASFGPTFW